MLPFKFKSGRVSFYGF